MWSIRQLLSLSLAVGFAILMSPQLAWPHLYQCREANGATVFTDSTAQLQHCRPVNTGTPTRLSYPAGAPARSSGSPVVPQDPEPPSVPDPSELLLEPVPDASAEDDALPGTQAQPPCIAGINPLNPFGGSGCTPTENTVTVQPDLPLEPMMSEGTPP